MSVKGTLLQVSCIPDKTKLEKQQRVNKRKEQHLSWELQRSQVFFFLFQLQTEIMSGEWMSEAALSSFVSRLLLSCSEHDAERVRLSSAGIIGKQAGDWAVVTTEVCTYWPHLFFLYVSVNVMRSVYK